VPRTLRVCLVLAVLAAAGAVGFFLLRKGAQSAPEASPPVVAGRPFAPAAEAKVRPVRDPEAETLAVALDAGAKYAERTAAIEKLGNRLGAGMVEAVTKAVKDREGHPAIRNDLLVRLERQEKPVGTLGPLLVGMYGDQTYDAVWKSYCLQHLAPAWTLEPEHRKAIADHLFGVLEKDGSGGQESALMYETAMLSLSKIGASDADVAGRVSKLARERIAARKSDPERAVTAMHVATGVGDKTILPEARELAADEKAMLRLRMSAIAALGNLGEAGDLEILKSLAGRRDGPVKKAAELNLAALKSRLEKK
jgi:hypothetical protein